MAKGYLHFEEGGFVEGSTPEWFTGELSGELVFNTGMTGYVEALTDPSYAGQHLLFTYPMMGNYGALGEEFWESERVQVTSMLFSEPSESFSHARAESSLLSWLEKQNVPSLFGVDTRELTKKVRSQGTVIAVLSRSSERPAEFIDPSLTDLVKAVQPSQYQVALPGMKKLIVVDCGMKRGIYRGLQREGVEIKHVGYDYDFTAEPFDGLFLSNGPGNPERCTATIENVRKVLGTEVPIFGICLGAQLLALAAGAKTYKLPFGHRGQNQPCQEVTTGRCYLTSQNHGYAVDEASLPVEWEVSFRNLNDGSVEGIRHKSRPHYAVQFHPEAAPGPEDTHHLFEEFLEKL